MEALELDVRPLVAAKQPPIGAILAMVDRLEPGQDFVLIAPFEPVPLYSMLGQRGYDHQSRLRDDGAWEIRFFGL